MTSITDILAMEPCPFCGEQPIIEHAAIVDVAFCNKCKYSKRFDKWNTRAPTQEAILGKKLSERMTALVGFNGRIDQENIDSARAALAEWNKLEGVK